MLPHSSAIVPILLWEPKAGHPIHVGSAVLLRIGTATVLLTAAHVTDLRQEGKLCIPSRRGVTDFAGSIGANPLPPGLSRNQDPIDVGFLVPSEGSQCDLPSEYTPIAPADVDLTNPVLPGEFCLVAGVPLSRNWAKHSGAEVTGSRLNFVGIAYPHATYAARGYDPRTNILIEYHLDKAIYPEGDRANPPSPRGMSGGGVFRLGRDAKGSPDSSRAELVGVMHKFVEREHMFVSTAIRAVLKLLLDSLPDEVRRRFGA